MAKNFGDRWEVVEALSEGGQGHTFIVRDIKNPADPIKYVLKHLKNPNRLDRFRREVDASLKLDHPNILKIVDSDLCGGTPFLVSEYCTGGTLRTLFENQRHSIQEVFRLFLAIASGLQYAHGRGVVHRDIKPDNIFLRLPLAEPVIGDFGLCFFDEPEDRITMTEEAVGPRLFMAPELEDGRVEEVVPSADIYSLGKLFYWLLAGGRVFSREKLREPRWDLKNILPHPFEEGTNFQMEHVTRLLEFMIVAEPSKRGTLKDIISSAMRIQSMIHRAINPVGKNIPQTCTYCGWGQYILVASGNEVYNFGLNQVGNPNWRVMACSECGHIQLFRLDHAKPGNWWVQESR